MIKSNHLIKIIKMIKGIMIKIIIIVNSYVPKLMMMIKEIISNHIEIFISVSGLPWLIKVNKVTKMICDQTG